MIVMADQLNLFNQDAQPHQSWREKYNSVIRSTKWRKLRDRFLKKHDNRCSRCNWQKIKFDQSRKLELHHKTYERLGNECDEDLELLCSICHAKADQERLSKSQARAKQNLYDSRFSSWAEKVYGDDFYYFEDESMHERFTEWLDRKDWE